MEKYLEAASLEPIPSCQALSQCWAHKEAWDKFSLGWEVTNPKGSEMSQPNFVIPRISDHCEVRIKRVFWRNRKQGGQIQEQGGRDGGKVQISKTHNHLSPPTPRSNFWQTSLLATTDRPAHHYVAAVNNTTIGISLGTKPCIPRVVLGRGEQIIRYSNNIQILFE